MSGQGSPFTSPFQGMCHPSAGGHAAPLSQRLQTCFISAIPCYGKGLHDTASGYLLARLKRVLQHKKLPMQKLVPLESKHPTPPANEARNGTASTVIELFAHVHQIKRFHHFCQPSHIRSSNIFAKIPSHELIAITVVPEINVDVGLPFVPVFPAQAAEKVHIVNGGSQIINSLNYQHCRISTNLTQALRPLFMVQNLGPTCIWSDSNPLGSSGTPASHDSSQSHSIRPTGFQFLKLMGNQISQSTQGYVARLKGPERSKTVLATMQCYEYDSKQKSRMHLRHSIDTPTSNLIKSIDLRAIAAT